MTAVGLLFKSWNLATSQNYLDGPSGIVFLESSDMVRNVFSLMQASNKVTLWSLFIFPFAG